MTVSNKWQLSSLEYKIDFLLCPLLLAAGIALGPFSLPQLVLGVLLWSLAEYTTHRFLFHRRFRKDHWAHHVAPTAYIGISGIAIGIGYGTLLVPARLLGITSVHAGFMLGYFAYLCVHYAIHRPRFRAKPLLRVLADNHAMHHQRGIEKNFGVTSPLWDVLLRTYAGGTPQP